MANKVGSLIKEARTAAGLSQKALAEKIDGLTANDISKAEQGEKELSQTILREIAKATGVTQKSLIDAAKESTYGAKKPSSSAKTTSSKNTLTLTATEKKLVELYRAADSETKKSVMALLKGEDSDSGDLITSLLGMLGKGNDTGDMLSSLLDKFGKK